MYWDCEADQVFVSAPSATKLALWSRKTLLRCVASCFDPLGLTAPILIRGKILLQQAWKEGGGWNTPLGDELSRAAEEWWGEVETIEQLKYERWLKATPGESYSLHAFADASEVAYGACVYLVSAGQSALIYVKA